MKNNQLSLTYVALLRGINVGGHHKVPMAILKREMTNLGFKKISTLLNSGNVIFETAKTGISELESKIEEHLEKCFGFPVPVLLRELEDLIRILKSNPFKNIEVKKEIRLYVTFFKQKPKTELLLPWNSDDKSYKILEIKEKAIFSVLDLSVSDKLNSMEILGQIFGKEITTRNLNTINKIVRLNSKAPGSVN